MKKILITEKRFERGGKMFGKNGEYVVNDTLAKQLEKEQKAKILEDLGKGPLDTNEPQSFEDQQENQKFLDLVKANAREIVDIIQEVIGEDDEDTDKKNKNNDSSSNNDDSIDTSPKSDNDDLGDPDDDKNKSRDNSDDDSDGGDNSDDDSEVVESDIPDRFPAHDKLIAAGVVLLKDIPRDKEALMEKVPELNDRSANAIGIKLAEIDESK
ncbi:MAG: hypothetical protein WBP82_08510 [Leuconostoc mesenteroides]